jgi:hypothetical protein
VFVRRLLWIQRRISMLLGNGIFVERCWVCDVRWMGDVRRKEGGARGGARSFPMMQSLTTT